jgi:hypothetical protein
MDDRVDAAPDLVGPGRDLTQAGDDLASESGVAGHRGVADDVGVGQVVSDLVDLRVAEIAGLAQRSAQARADRAVAIGGDVVRKRVLVDLGHVRRHLAKAARGYSVFE